MLMIRKITSIITEIKEQIIHMCADFFKHMKTQKQKIAYKRYYINVYGRF